MSARLIRKSDDLAPFIADWKELSREAIEPNVYYESFLLFNALKHLPASNFEALLVFGSDGKLIGLFPLSDNSRYRGFPIKHFGNFQYMHCYLRTPLVRKARENECFREFFNWLDRESNARFVEFRMCSLDGPFAEALRKFFALSPRRIKVTSQFKRALLSSTLAPKEYIETALPKKRRKEFKRLRRRLEELGELQVEVLAPKGNIDRWVYDFLALEESGWKGERGTALNIDQSQRNFFAEAVKEAFSEGKLLMLKLTLEDKPIAMQAHFKSGSGSFSFKIAYDEQYAHFSPGVLLELDLIRHLLEKREVEWMDSCADPEHSMINRLWKERRLIGHIVIARKTRLSRAAVQVLGLAHHLRAIFLRRKENGREAFAN